METLNTMPSWERAEKYEEMYDEELTKRIEFEDKCINLQSKIDKAINFINSKHNWYGDEEEDNEDYLFELEDFELLLNILKGE